MADVISRMAYGHINLEGQSLNSAILRVRLPFQRDSAVNTGRRDIGKRSSHAASPHRTEGGFTAEQVAHPEGTIVLLQATETKRSMPYAQAALFLRLRSQGDMLSIKVKCPTNHLTILGDSFEVFRGRADVLTKADLRALAVEVPRKFQNAYMSQTEVDELFRVDVIAKGTAKPQIIQVATEDGGTEIVTVAKPTVRQPRRLRG